MTGITNPAEEYFKDGLWGWVTNAWKKLVATAGGALHIQFAGQEADVEVTQTAAADLVTGGHGWDGDSWHKLPMVWGYSERYVEYQPGAAIGAGDASAVTVAVDAGYVHVIQAFSVYHNAGANKVLQVYVTEALLYAYLFHDLTAASGFWHTWQGEIVLEEGDQIVASVTAPGAGKVIYLRLWGYKMKIAE